MGWVFFWLKLWLFIFETRKYLAMTTQALNIPKIDDVWLQIKPCITNQNIQVSISVVEMNKPVGHVMTEERVGTKRDKMHILMQSNCKSISCGQIINLICQFYCLIFCQAHRGDMKWSSLCVRFYC